MSLTAHSSPPMAADFTERRAAEGIDVDRLGLTYLRVSARSGIRGIPNWGIAGALLDVRVRQVCVAGPIEFASPARRQVLSHMRHLLVNASVPLWGPPEGRGARTPGRSHRQAPGATELQRHRAGLSILLEEGTGPAVETSNPASRLVAHRAVGGIRPWVEILAAGPARIRLYSFRGRLCEPLRNSLFGSSAGAIPSLAA